MPRGFEAGPALAPMSLHTGSSPDELIALLPPKASERFAILTSKRDDAHRLIPEADIVRQLNAEKFRLERALQALEAPAGDGGAALPSTDLRILTTRRQLDAITAKSKTTQERYAQRAAEFQAIARPHTDTMAWITHGRPPNTIMEDAPEPRLGKGPLLDQLEDARRRSRELASDLNRVRSSCYPAAYCKTKATAEIEALAQRGAISVSQMIEHDGSLVFPTMSVQVSLRNTGQPALGFCEIPDFAVLAFIHKDALLAAVLREIDSEADDQNSLDHAARQIRESEILGDILENDRLEAALTFRGWADGLSILPRADLQPAAWLNVSLLVQPAREPGSSPERQSFEVLGPRGRRS